jgi:hypothetical protein
MKVTVYIPREMQFHFMVATLLPNGEVGHGGDVAYFKENCFCSFRIGKFFPVISPKIPSFHQFSITKVSSVTKDESAAYLSEKKRRRKIGTQKRKKGRSYVRRHKQKI